MICTSYIICYTQQASMAKSCRPLFTTACGVSGLVQPSCSLKHRLAGCLCPQVTQEHLLRLRYTVRVFELDLICAAPCLKLRFAQQFVRSCWHKSIVTMDTAQTIHAQNLPVTCNCRCSSDHVLHALGSRIWILCFGSWCHQSGMLQGPRTAQQASKQASASPQTSRKPDPTVLPRSAAVTQAQADHVRSSHS